MPAYIFDNANDDRWNALDTFTKAYIETAFWLGDDSDDNDEGISPNIPDRSFAELSDDAIESIKKDRLDFQQSNKTMLGAAYDMTDGDYDDSRAGHDFFLTRNHHGAGFWDRDLGDTGDRLTKSAHAYGESDLYLGDDELFYVS